MPFEVMQATPYKKRDIVAKPLDQLESTMGTLSNKHFKAIEQKNAISNYLGSLDLNESEQEWAHNYANDINNRIEENVQFGNYAGALTSASEEAGRISNDPALRGRIKSQQEYKAFINALDADKEMDTSVKERARAVNQYKYSDITNEEGKVIGGSTWTPDFKPVKTVDRSKLLEEAKRMAMADSHASSTDLYMGADGNLTPDINKSIDGMTYQSRASSSKRGSQAKLKQALEAVINNTPGARESIMQDYETALWHIENNDNISPAIRDSVLDENGRTLSPDEYIAKMADPFYKAASYYETSVSVKNGEGFKKLNERRAASEEMNKTMFNMATEEGPYINRKIKSLSNVKGIINDINQNYDAIIEAEGIELPKNASYSDKYKAIVDSINNATDIDDAQKVNIINQLTNNEQRRKDAELSYANSVKGLSVKDRDTIDFLGMVNNGSDLNFLPNSNSIKQEYVKAINNVFKGNGENLRFKLNHNDNAQTVYKELKNLGVEVNGDDGTVTINRNSPQSIVPVLKLLKDYGTTYETNLYDKEGNKIDEVITDTHSAAKGQSLNYTTQSTTNRSVNKLYGIYDKAVDRESKIEGISSNYITSSKVYGANSLADITFQKGLGKYSDVNAAIKDNNNQYDNLIRQSNLVNKNVYVAPEGQVAEALPSGELRSEINKLLKIEAANNNVNYSAFSNNGEIGTSFNLIVNTDDKNDKNRNEKKAILKKLGYESDNGVVVLNVMVEDFAPSVITNTIKETGSYRSQRELADIVNSGVGIKTLYDDGSNKVSLEYDKNKGVWYKNSNGSVSTLNESEASKENQLYFSGKTAKSKIEAIAKQGNTPSTDAAINAIATENAEGLCRIYYDKPLSQCTREELINMKKDLTYNAYNK